MHQIRTRSSGEASGVNRGASKEIGAGSVGDLERSMGKTGKGEVLVVDDEASNRILVRRVLELIGYRVDEATNGAEAIAAVVRRLPDLVLLDLEMPVMNGYDVLRALKSDVRTRLIPVIMLTSHDQLSMVPAFSSSSVNRFRDRRDLTRAANSRGLTGLLRKSSAMC